MIGDGACFMTKEYKKFYETDIWIEAYELQKDVFDLTRKFPKEEKYGLGGQLNDSSNSVVANIAESHGRYHFADKIRVLYIIRGEVEETQSHLIVAVSRRYASKEEITHLVERYERLKMKINGYIGDLSRKKGQ